MSNWSIHLENEKYVVREDYIARAIADAKPGEEGAGEEGEEVGTYSTRLEAAARVNELQAKQKKEIRIVAAKALLGV